MKDLIAAVLDLGLGRQLEEQTNDKVEDQKKKLFKPPVPENAYGANLMSNSISDLLGPK